MRFNDMQNPLTTAATKESLCVIRHRLPQFYQLIHRLENSLQKNTDKMGILEAI